MATSKSLQQTQLAHAMCQVFSSSGPEDALTSKVFHDERAERAQVRLAILRLPEVMARVGLKRSTIYAKIASQEFPAPISLSAKGAVGWVESEIHAWISERISQSRKTA